MSDDDYDMDAYDADDMEYMDDDGDGSDAGSDDDGSGSDDEAAKKDPKKWTKVDLENQYYKSKDLEEDKGVDAAIAGFEKVLEMEKVVSKKPANWSFKALKKIVALYFKKGEEKKVEERFHELLRYNSAENGVTENDLFKGITSILDTVSAAAATQTDLVLKLYELALTAMQGAGNENLWFKTNLKLAQKMFDKGLYVKLQKIIEQLTSSCMLPDGSENPKKGNQLLEVYSLEIQMHMEKKDTKKVKELYEKGFSTAKRNPGTLNSKLAIFHFVGGKLKMEEHSWNDAYSSFFEAFNFFEEAGSRFKIPCLKYILLANMLNNSTINPFASPETKNLQNHAEIKPMAELLAAYQHNEIDRFEKILNINKKVILDDPFIAQFIANVLREIRTQVLLEIIRPYTKVTIPFLAKKLNVPPAEVQELLVFLILDSKVVGQIDQVKQQLHLQKGGPVAKYRYIGKWSDQLRSLHGTVLNRVS